MVPRSKANRAVGKSRLRLSGHAAWGHDRGNKARHSYRSMGSVEMELAEISKRPTARVKWTSSIDRCEDPASSRCGVGQHSRQRSPHRARQIVKGEPSDLIQLAIVRSVRSGAGCEVAEERESDSRALTLEV